MILDSSYIILFILYIALERCSYVCRKEEQCIYLYISIVKLLLVLLLYISIIHISDRYENNLNKQHEINNTQQELINNYKDIINDMYINNLNHISDNEVNLFNSTLTLESKLDSLNNN